MFMRLGCLFLVTIIGQNYAQFINRWHPGFCLCSTKESYCPPVLEATVTTPLCGYVWVDCQVLKTEKHIVEHPPAGWPFTRCCLRGLLGSGPPRPPGSSPKVFSGVSPEVFQISLCERKEVEARDAAYSLWAQSVSCKAMPCLLLNSE